MSARDMVTARIAYLDAAAAVEVVEHVLQTAPAWHTLLPDKQLHYARLRGARDSLRRALCSPPEDTPPTPPQPRPLPPNVIPMRRRR